MGGSHFPPPADHPSSLRCPAAAQCGVAVPELAHYSCMENALFLFLAFMPAPEILRPLLAAVPAHPPVLGSYSILHAACPRPRLAPQGRFSNGFWYGLVVLTSLPASKAGLVERMGCACLGEKGMCLLCHQVFASFGGWHLLPGKRLARTGGVYFAESS